jgi:hypothetical protein
MHGLPLTPAEVVQRVRQTIRQFEEIGLPQDAALLAAANVLKVEPHKVEALTLDEGS